MVNRRMHTKAGNLIIPLVVLALALTTAFADDLRPAPATAGSCQPLLYETDTNETLYSILEDLGVWNLTTWPVVCVDSNLTTLESCFLPTVGTQLSFYFPCEGAPVLDRKGSPGWDALFNFTSFEDYADAVADIAQTAAARGMDVEAVIEVVKMSADLPEGTLTMYEPLGSCGPGPFTLPTILTGRTVERCCQAHDTCYDNCGGFATCNNQMVSCIRNWCNHFRWYDPRKYLCRVGVQALPRVLNHIAVRVYYCTVNNQRCLRRNGVLVGDCSASSVLSRLHDLGISV